MVKIKNLWATDIVVKDGDINLQLVGTREDDGDPLTEDFISDGVTEITDEQLARLKSHGDTSYYFETGILSVVD